MLAHNGVLFLDELSEFARPALEALRQPLEDGRVAIVRAQHSAVYPARFMLVAATNPCPCGYAGDWERCRCSETELARHRRRLSGPLLDRIDLLVKLESEGATGLERGAADELGEGARAGDASARAPGGAPARRGGDGERADGRAHAATPRAARCERPRSCCARDQERGLLSARGQHRVLRVARTIADLNGSERVRARDVGSALAMRSDTRARGKSCGMKRCAPHDERAPRNERDLTRRAAYDGQTRMA